MHTTGPFTIPAIRNFVPEKLKPWIIIVFVIIFQLSGGVYLAAVGEMVGSLSLMQEDIMMAGYASFVGMALTFTIMFRLKFRFTSKTSLLTCCIVLIICNLICMHTSSIPVLTGTCFVAGLFRMWGTFECNSTIQLWLTPKRDLSVFFCFIYLLVHGCIQFSGIITVYTAFLSSWEYMHLLIVGLLGCMMLAVILLFRTCRTLRKLPLYGIDRLGALLWASTLLSFIFVCVYGEYYDWFESVYIRTAVVVGFVTLALNIWRASFIRHPYIALKSWSFRIVYLTVILYVIVDILLAPSHLFEHIYMETVLGYDSLNYISLNWAVFAGIVTGALFTWQTFADRKWRYRTMNAIAFSAIIAYLVIFYFLIDYNLSKEALILPLFLRGFGYVIIAVSFLTSLSRVPFPNFFQTLSIQAFVSACIGGAFGTAVLSRALKVLTVKNAMLLAAETDNVNPIACRFAPVELHGALQRQALMVSMKELFGWLALAGICCLLLLLIKESNIRPKAIHPTFKVIRGLMTKREF